MEMYGRQWTRRELEARVGRIEQIGGLRRFTMAEGREAGTEMIQVRSGAGLAYDVLPGKGLDISLAEFAGSPLSWQAMNGDVHPSYYDAQGAEWLRTASGGLLMTCGLVHVGNPGTYGGKSYGLHGRAHHNPARQVGAWTEWNGDDCEIRIRGVVEETAIHGEHLRMTRTITGRLGENRISLEDRVENAGFAPCPHMMLYHFNFGFPLLTEESVIRFPEAAVTPRDPGTDMQGYKSWTKPADGVRERVYYHDLAAQQDGWAEVAVMQPKFPAAGRFVPLAVKLRWQTDTLPRFVQWHMPGAGMHVLGIEPSNCGVEGMAAEAERGKLRYLEPGEQAVYRLELIVEAGGEPA